MIGFRCECGPAIDCTYPKCKEGVEMSSKDITKRLRDYARDYTTTTYHDDLIHEAVTETESLRQQVTLLQDALLEISQVACSLSPEQKIANKALAATAPKEH